MRLSVLTMEPVMASYSMPVVPWTSGGRKQSGKNRNKQRQLKKRNKYIPVEGPAASGSSTKVCSDRLIPVNCKNEPFGMYEIIVS